MPPTTLAHSSGTQHHQFVLSGESSRAATAATPGPNSGVHRAPGTLGLPEEEPPGRQAEHIQCRTGQHGDGGAGTPVSRAWPAPVAYCGMDPKKPYSLVLGPVTHHKPSDLNIKRDKEIQDIFSEQSTNATKEGPNESRAWAHKPAGRSGQGSPAPAQGPRRAPPLPRAPSPPPGTRGRTHPAPPPPDSTDRRRGPSRSSVPRALTDP